MGKILKEKLMVVAGIGVIILLVLAFVYGRRLGKSEVDGLIEERKQITEDVLVQQMEGIGELNTAKYYYTNMGRYENTLQFKGQNIPFTQKAFIISYDGTIKAGVDLKDIAVVIDGKKIRFTIPPAKILSHDVDMESVTVFDEKNSIFNGLSTEDVTNFLMDQNKRMEERAEASGILTEAQENTKDCLNTLFAALLQTGDYEEGYLVEFVMQGVQAAK